MAISFERPRGITEKKTKFWEQKGLKHKQKTKEPYKTDNNSQTCINSLALESKVSCTSVRERGEKGEAELMW